MGLPAKGKYERFGPKRTRGEQLYASRIDKKTCPILESIQKIALLTKPTEAAVVRLCFAVPRAGLGNNINSDVK